MLDILELFCQAGMDVTANAHAESREATAEEHRAALEKVWDKWLEASVARDMTAAGFVRTDTGWKR